MVGRAPLFVVLMVAVVASASGQAKAPVRAKTIPTPAEAIVARLQVVPVFVLMDSAGVPLLAGDRKGNQRVVVFLRRSLAESAVAGVRRADPAVGRRLVIRAAPLGDLFGRFQGGATPRLAMVPDPEEVARARKVLALAGKSTTFDGVPLFVAKSAGAKGYLNVTQQGKTFIPVFFSLSELEQLQAQARAESKQTTVAATTVEVLTLEALLTRWQASKDPTLGRITLVPAAKAVAEATP